MPNTKSAKKRLRQSLIRRTRNRSTKAELKTLVRKVRQCVIDKDLEKAATAYNVCAKGLDQAAAKGIIHRNLASRVKSRLSAYIKAAKQPPAKT